MKRIILSIFTFVIISMFLSIASFAGESCEKIILDADSIEEITTTNSKDASLFFDGVEDSTGTFNNPNTGLSWSPSATGDSFTVTLKQETVISDFAIFTYSFGSTYKFEFFDKSGTSVYSWEEVVNNTQVDTLEPIYIFQNQSYNIKSITFTITNLKLNSYKTCLISELYIYSQNHSYKAVSYSFPNGFSGNCILNKECSICGSSTSQQDSPIFEHLGYSIKSNSSLGLCAMFNINSDALKWYKENISNDFTYGVVVANIENFYDSSFFDKNGCITNEKSIQLQVTDDTYSRLNITITDFSAETSNLELVIFMYVKQGDTYTYIQKAPYDGYYTNSVAKNGVSLGAITISRVQSLVDTTTVYALPNKENEN